MRKMTREWEIQNIQKKTGNFQGKMLKLTKHNKSRYKTNKTKFKPKYLFKTLEKIKTRR